MESRAEAVSLPSNKDIPRRTRALSPCSVAVPTSQPSLGPTNSSSESPLGPPLTGYVVSPRGKEGGNTSVGHLETRTLQLWLRNPDKTVHRPELGLDQG